ncbi:YfhO family protein [Skermania sp. ID1734]|uniref:YfhO family protein n=1 Tax=Skermania sp. ID1734 TaxID=2597516 RepID=UPI00117F729E|nr:YfhO family protein [Skermania sp. ID1734]TSE00712.1 YfhO family protein [Skermania sp. ID1734]
MPQTRTTPPRFERVLWWLAMVAVIVVGFVVIGLHEHRYFYQDDTESGAIGNWLQLGRIIRAGHFPSLVLDAWMSGNYPVEGQGGLWNPVQMLINVVAPSIDNLALLAAGVKLIFSIILGWGIFRVAREYGARPGWAAVAGASAPFAGFTLFFEQPSWVTSLIGAAWVLQAWASGIRYARGKSGPIPVFVFLYLAITVGYVHAALMSGLVIACLIAGEWLVARSWRPAARVAAAGIAAAAAGAITYLPGVLSSGVTWRDGAQGVVNNNFLVAPWSETLTASIPTSVSSIQSWSGETTYAPVTYISWFVVPALAFVAWRSVGPALRELAAPAAFLVAILLFTAGPSDIGQIRWPARLLPYAAITVLILVTVLLSRFGTLRPLRPRLVAAGLIVLVLLLRAGSSGPQYFGRHALSALFIIVVGGLALYLARRYGPRSAAALLLVPIVPIALYQVSSYPHVLTQWFFPTTQSAAKAEFPDFPGANLQLGNRGLIKMAPGPHSPWHAQVYGNYAKDLDLSYVNNYTPVGHIDFSQLLCMTYDGSTCKDAFHKVFAVDPWTQRTFVDLMMIDRVILQRKQYPHVDQQPPPPGWKWVPVAGEAGRQIAVLERVDGPVSTRGNRISATVNASATPEESTTNTARARVSSDHGGSVVFARLAWPGYRATLNGQPLQTKGLGGVFLYVDLPPGTHDAELVISFRPPGERLGFAGMAFGVVVLLVLVGIDLRSRRKRRPRAHPTTHPTDTSDPIEAMQPIQ